MYIYYGNSEICTYIIVVNFYYKIKTKCFIFMVIKTTTNENN